MQKQIITEKYLNAYWVFYLLQNIMLKKDNEVTSLDYSQAN